MKDTGVYYSDGSMVKEFDIIERDYAVGVVIPVEDEFCLARTDITCIEEEYSGMTPYEVYLSGGNCVEFDTVNSFFGGEVKYLGSITNKKGEY